MALTANTFAKCAPAISTNIKQCGTVALCDAKPLTTDDLTTAYMKSGSYRVMEALLMFDIEIKQCEATQLGLYEFLMANKVNMSKRVVPTGPDSLTRIMPFIKAKQFSPINNEYWLFRDGDADGNNWEVEVLSAGNVPFDVRSFSVGMPLYLNGQSAGGSAIRTAYRVVSATAGDKNGGNTSTVGTLVLEGMNDNSNLDPDKLGDPEVGYLTRGSKNVDDFESDCDEQPAYLTKKLVPFWIGTTRWSMCKSSKYDEFRDLMGGRNKLWDEFGDVPEVDKNRQLAMDFQKRWVQNFFMAKALPNQTLADYDNLDDITSFEDTDIGLGVDGGICVGKRAEPVGVYEQLAECDRVVDLQGDILNLPALFQGFYNIIRVRASQGNTSRVIDVFTDSQTAELINTAMINYYNAKFNNTLRTTLAVGENTVSEINPIVLSRAKQANFGFYYRSYPLSYPQGVTMNVLTHWSFDDELSVAQTAGITNTARRLWVLDFTGIYPGIVASNRLVAKTGDLATLTKVNPAFACVMRVHTRQQTLNSMTYTTIVECPSASLIIENFSGDVPNHAADDAVPVYPQGDSSTTTTTQ